MNQSGHLNLSEETVTGCPVVVVRLAVHVHFNMGLSPRDSCVPGQRPSVCSIGLTVSV